MALPPPTKLDANQAIQGAYDDAQGRLRVDASVTATIGDVVINADESSIAIQDPSNNNVLHINNDGSINVDTVIKASAGDNIAIADPTGTNFLLPNTDGSIKSVQLFTIPFDTITATYPLATQEVYISRVGGTGGSIQQTLTVNYTDSSKAFISSVVRT